MMNKLTFASVLVIVSFVLISSEVDSASVGEFMSGAKNYLAGLVRDGIISKSTVLSSFDKTMTNIRERYEKAKQNGELEGKDEQEASAIYYKIVVDEVRALREQLSAEKQEESAAGDFMQACSLADPSKYASEYDVDMMDMDGTDDEEEDELMNQLNELEALSKEAEMGWGLDPESKAALKTRTLAVLADLVQNELKNVVMIVITGLCAGGPTAGPVTAALNVSIKFKLMELITHNLMDMLAAMLGKKIEPQMVFSTEQKDGAEPAAATAS